jgi:hypothetical protein
LMVHEFPFMSRSHQMVSVRVEDDDLSSFRVCLRIQPGTKMKANEVRRDVMSTVIAKLPAEHVAELFRVITAEATTVSVEFPF